MIRMIRGKGQYVRRSQVAKLLEEDESVSNSVAKRFPGLEGEVGDMVVSVAAAFTDSPEMRLVAEVMLSAIEILNRGDRGEWDDPYAETRRWIKRKPTDWPFDFVPICDRLGLDPDATRKVLLDLKPSGLRFPVKTICGYAGTRPKLVVSDDMYGGWRRRGSFRYGDMDVA